MIRVRKSQHSADFRFGIVGTGAIAHRFAAEISGTANVVAVASRRLDRARAFASQFDVPTACASVEALVAEEVDAVYIATPAHLHLEHGLAALAAERPVLCEKPFALTADEAAELAAAAGRAGVFCMEAMWTRFNPLVGRLRDLITNGSLGEIVSVRADIGFSIGPDSRHEGDPVFQDIGPLLDLGVYGVSLAQFLWGTPQSSFMRANSPHETAEATLTAGLDYPGFTMILTTSSRSTLRNTFEVVGTRSRVELGAPFFNPSTLTRVPVVASGRPRAHASGPRAVVAQRLRQSPVVSTIRSAAAGRIDQISSAGLRYEVDEVIRCIRQGRLESEIMPLADTIAVMSILDTLDPRSTPE